MRFSRSTHSLICLSLETLNSIIRTGYPVLVELIDFVNSCYNFFISNDPTVMVNFPMWYLTVTLTVLLVWISFFLLMLVFVTQWLSEAFPPLGNSDHVVVLISIDIPSNLKWDAPFHLIAYDCSLISETA